MRPRDVLWTGRWSGDRIDVRIEVSFSRLDPPEGRAIRVARGDRCEEVEARAFVGWLGLLGLLQLLTDEHGEAPPA